jgi:4-hydroxythreonine-4-phosphate dehydrogenase
MRILALTPGDPAGIGPEVTWKALRRYRGRNRILCIGARAPFEKLGARIIEADPVNLVPPHISTPHVWLLSAPAKAPRILHLEGYQSGWSIVAATDLVLRGVAQALVTGPISKERLQKGGFPYEGHTEFLADLTGAEKVTMMLANETLRISLVTIHAALQDVPKLLTRDSIERAILQTCDHLRRWWGIRRPRVAITSLNPHAGENGLFGKQEIQVISPTVRSLQRKLRGKAALSGPLSADTLFAKHLDTPPRERFDAVVCMYHDQGLIPVKLLDFHRTVNVTLGLPIVRTSVDHGVGFDIAGKGIANPSSLESAIDLASRIVRNSG